MDTTPINIAFIWGARIREARLAARLTQEQLAERAGIQPTHLSRIERGGVEPRHETQQAIAKALGVEQSVLFRIEAREQ